MANISDAYGSMSLKGSWTPVLIEHLNRIARELWATWCYDTVVDPFDPNGSPEEWVSTFNGNGRWAFSSNLESLGRWTLEEIPSHPELSDAFAELIREMKANGLIIKVDYSDEEPGCLVLYSETGEIYSNGETFEYKEVSYQGYDYNWTNYMEVTGDDDCFYEFVENICKKIGIESNEEIEDWVEKNSYPHCSEFEYLDDDKQAEFKTLFASSTA